MRENYQKTHRKWQFEGADDKFMGNPHISDKNWMPSHAPAKVSEQCNTPKMTSQEGATAKPKTVKGSVVSIKWLRGPAFEATGSGKPKVKIESHPIGYQVETQEKLTQAARDALPASAFADPKNRRFPMHDKSHARFAVAMKKHAGSAKVKKKIDAKAENKGIEVSG